jgi:hypothetical protein
MTDMETKETENERCICLVRASDTSEHECSRAGLQLLLIADVLNRRGIASPQGKQ